MKLNLHIDRLVLNGADWDTAAIDAFERGLQETLAREFQNHRGGNWPAGAFGTGTSEPMRIVLGEPGSAGAMGEALGRALHRGMRG